MAQDFVFHFGSLLVLILVTVVTLQRSLVELDTAQLSASIVPAGIQLIPGRVTRAVRNEKQAMESVYNSINNGISQSQIITKIDNFITQVFNGVSMIKLPKFDTLDFGQSSRQIQTEIKK